MHSLYGRVLSTMTLLQISLDYVFPVTFSHYYCKMLLVPACWRTCTWISCRCAPDLVHPCFDLLTKPFSSIVALHVLNFNDMARYFSSNSYHFSPLEQLWAHKRHYQALPLVLYLKQWAFILLKESHNICKWRWHYQTFLASCWFRRGCSLLIYMPWTARCELLYSLINVSFPFIPVMQINRSCAAVTSLLVPTLFWKPFLWDQQLWLT